MYERSIMKSKKYIVVILVLIMTVLISHSLPKAKYVGTGFISTLNIPKSISDWEAKDITKEIGLNVNISKYDFVSEALAYRYVNKEGKSIIFIILDAANFHHPKACFTGAGYKINDLKDKDFNFSDHTIKTHNLFTTRGKESSLSFYWIVIDRNIAHEWIEQKYKQLVFSLFGKKRVGLMIRVDIPAEEKEIEGATILAEQFMLDLRRSIPSDQVDYIFGAK